MLHWQDKIGIHGPSASVFRKWQGALGGSMNQSSPEAPLASAPTEDDKLFVPESVRETPDPTYGGDEGTLSDENGD